MKRNIFARNAKWMSLVSFAPLVVSLSGILVVLSACGGGGGGATGGPNEDIVVGTYGVRGIRSTIDSLRTIRNIPASTSRTRGRQQDDCPQINVGETSDGRIFFEFDYGSGCVDPDDGTFTQGKFTLVFEDLEFDEDGDPIRFGSFEVRYANYKSGSDPLINGKITLSPSSSGDSLNITLNIRENVSSNCVVETQLSGSITYTEGWFTDYWILNGTGAYSSPATGRVNIRYNNLVHSGLCDYPVGGSVIIQAGRAQATLSFLESGCGTALFSIGNSAPTPIDLEEFDSNPCVR